MARHESWVKLDIAKFSRAVYRLEESECHKWLNDLLDCLIDSDPSKSEFGAILLGEYEDHLQKDRERKKKKPDVPDFPRSQTESVESVEFHGKTLHTDIQTYRHTENTENTENTEERLTPVSEVRKPKNSDPTHDEVAEYCKELGISDVMRDDFFSYYDMRGWKTNRGVKVAKWKIALKRWGNRDMEGANARFV